LATPEERLQLVRDILEVPEEELDTPFGRIKVRYPTTRDRLEAEASARQLPFWDSLSTEEKTYYVMRELALRILVEPKVEDPSKANELVLEQILNVVIAWYTAKRTYYATRVQPLLEHFLQQTRELLPKSSSIY